MKSQKRGGNGLATKSQELFAHARGSMSQRADDELREIIRANGNPYLVVVLAAQAQRRIELENRV